MDLSTVAFATPAETFGIPHIQPVCRLIDGPMKTLSVHKGLQQYQGMPEGLLPISGESLFAQRQHPRTQIGNMPVRKDQKTAVIDHQFEAIVLMAQVPTDPAISCCAFPGCRRETQKSYPLITPQSNIPKRFADLGRAAQVVMLLHQFLKPALLQTTSGPHNDFPQIQLGLPPLQVTMR